MAEIDEIRELLKDFWAGRQTFCRKHPGALLEAEHVRTTYSDHVTFTCARGKETFSVPQRPRQQKFNAWQNEGLVVFLERGDNVLCYRCQARLNIDRQGMPGEKKARFHFTCVRCYSWGEWEGDPSQASIEDPVSV